jgi:hypothetical protein
MENEHPLINTLINHHFCIENATAESILTVLDTSFTENILFDKEFDWDFLFGDKIDRNKKRFVLYDKINNWNYLRWNVWDFDEAERLTLHISEKLNTKVYYFFIDPWIFTIRWILADKGQLLKAYSESYDQILIDKGDFEIDEKIRTELQKQEDEFWEDKFWQLYEKICQPIEIMNKYQNIKAIKGELK